MVENACRAEASFALAESERMNAAALEAMVAGHGVQLRRFPQQIVDACRRSAGEVRTRFIDRGGLEARIARSYDETQGRLARWSTISLQAFLEARGDDARG